AEPLGSVERPMKVWFRLKMAIPWPRTAPEQRPMVAECKFNFQRRDAVATILAARATVPARWLGNSRAMSVHGTARFAERDDLVKAKLVRNRPPGEFPEGLMVGWWFEDMYDYTPIEYVGDQHQLIVAGTGGGKFTTGIATTLLGSHLEDSTVVVVDPKGEI